MSLPSNDREAERDDKKIKRTRNGLHHEAAHHLSSGPSAADYAKTNAQDEPAGFHVATGVETWADVARHSLDLQHRNQDANDPTKLQAEENRIYMETERMRAQYPNMYKYYPVQRDRLGRNTMLIIGHVEDGGGLSATPKLDLSPQTPASGPAERNPVIASGQPDNVAPAWVDKPVTENNRKNEQSGIHMSVAGETWQDVAKHSLMLQHRAKDVNDPAQVQAEQTRIFTETLKMRNAYPSMFNGKNLDYGHLDPNTQVVIGTFDHGGYSAYVPPQKEASRYVPIPNLPVATPSDVQMGVMQPEHNLSQHPLHSVHYGHDYMEDGLYMVTRQDMESPNPWMSIAARVLRAKNRPDLARNPAALKEEAAAIIWKTEQWHSEAHPDKPENPHYFDLEPGRLLKVWDNSDGPDPRHVWGAPRTALPGHFTEAMPGDRIYAPGDATVLAGPGSQVIYGPGANGAVMRGATADAQVQSKVLTDGVEVPHETGAVVRNIDTHRYE